MKIVMFNWRCRQHPRKGGAEVFTDEIARRWVDYGHEVTLFSAAVDGLPEQTTTAGIRHVRRGSRFTVYSEARRWWRDQGADLGFDLVIDEINTRPFGCHEWIGDVPTIAIMHQLAKEVWFYEMPMPAALLGRYVLEPYWLRSLRHTPVITVSNSSRHSFVEAGLQRVTVVPNGLDTIIDTEPVEKASTPTAVFVGRMASNKRPREAARAIELAARHLPGLELHLIGDGPELKALAKRPNVITHGFVDHETKRALVRRAHVQLVTSVREGWGLVVDEAAACGTPTIGYDIPGLRDSIAAAKGWIVEPRPEAMAEVILQNLPELMARPAAPGWAGGTASWDDVAPLVLAEAVANAQSPTAVIDLEPRRPLSASTTRVEVTS